MNMPAFTADSSLYKGHTHYHQPVATRRGRSGDDAISPQASRETAEWVRSTLGFGQVYCSSKCISWGTGYDPGVEFCIYYLESCYWWPW
jgi:hypothetical protein